MPGTTAPPAQTPVIGGPSPSMRDHLAYYLRFAWVELKRRLGVSITGDNRHMCERIVRGVRAGRISSATMFTVVIRRDGLGSQVLSRLSVEAAARDLGLGYAHRPFEAIAHGEGDPAEWVERCERTFALGDGKPLLRDIDLPMVELSQFATNRRLWRQPHVVTIGNMFVHCDRNPEIYRRVVARADKVSTAETGPLKIAAHVRRGDVSTRRVSHRFTSNEIVASTLKRAIAEVEKAGLAYEVTVYSNGDPREFTAFSDLGWRVDVTSGALDVFGHLRNADVLLTAKSTFSYVAALNTRGIVLYEPFARRPLPSWIPRDAEGGFSAARLTDLLSRDASS